MRYQTGHSNEQTTTDRDAIALQRLANGIVDRVESLLLEAEAEVKPIEVDPYRGRLFELFVTADGAGYLEEDGTADLSADGLGRELGRRWDLASATEESVRHQVKLPPQHLSRMRLLWSFMRMWMEWTYAWQRWREFHDSDVSN